MDTTTATIQATSHGGNTGETSDAALLDADDTEYLTPNAQPTGFERNNNPEHWPEDHQRVPLYRQPVVNPAWYQIRGDSAGIRLFMWTMLSGCQLLQVCLSKASMA